jgi:hypothetical protein
VLAVLARPGIWRVHAFSGALLGMDMADAMASLPDGLDRDRARALLIVAEAAFVGAALEKTKAKDNSHGRT